MIGWSGEKQETIALANTALSLGTEPYGTAGDEAHPQGTNPPNGRTALDAPSGRRNTPAVDQRRYAVRKSNLKVYVAVVVVLGALLGTGIEGASGAAPPVQELDVAVRLPGFVSPRAGGIASAGPRLMNLANEGFVTFGLLDSETNTILDGEYLIRVTLDIGDAPLTAMTFLGTDPVSQANHTITATAEAPQAEGLFTVRIPGGLGAGNLVALHNMGFIGAAEGARGTATVTMAFIADPEAKTKNVPSITAEIEVLLDSWAGGFGLNGSWYVTDIGKK